jgi:hypothetical protein
MEQTSNFKIRCDIILFSPFIFWIIVVGRLPPTSPVKLHKTVFTFLPALIASRSRNEDDGVFVGTGKIQSNYRAREGLKMLRMHPFDYTGKLRIRCAKAKENTSMVSFIFNITAIFGGPR